LIEAGLVAARALHFAAVTALFGLALFPLYGCPSGAPPVRVRRWLRTSIRYAALVGLLSALAWAWFAVAGMIGTMTAATDSDTLLTVVRETSFGQVWVGRLALLAALLAFVAGSDAERHRHPLTVPVAALLLATLALVGHTQTNDGALRVVHVTADGAHLLAAGAWLGGLLALGYVLILAQRVPSEEHTAHAVATLVRFSGMGYAAVATLIISGLINAWVLVGSPQRR
jgi:putative copper resistance protein D